MVQIIKERVNNFFPTVLKAAVLTKNSLNIK